MVKPPAMQKRSERDGALKSTGEDCSEVLWICHIAKSTFVHSRASAACISRPHHLQTTFAVANSLISGVK